MKTSDNGSLFILDETLKLMEEKLKRKKKVEWKKRK
jgi:hypothetical protein